MIITDIVYKWGASSNRSLNTDTGGGFTAITSFPVHGDMGVQPRITLASGIPVPEGAAVKVNAADGTFVTLCGYLY